MSSADQNGGFSAERALYLTIHDLKAPIRQILSFAEFLEEDLQGEVPEQAARDLKAILECSRRAQQMLDELSALRDAGEREINLRRGPITAGLPAKSGALEADGLESAPEVSADPALLELFWSRLYEAVQRLSAHPPPHGVVTFGQDPGWVRIRIQVHGCVLKVDEIRKALSAGRLTSTRARDLGLSLSICRRIVERHGGRIDATDEAGATALEAAFPVAFPA